MEGSHIPAQYSMPDLTIDVYAVARDDLGQYSGPSLSMLSGHSQQSPPSLLWPQIFGAATLNAYILVPLQRPPL